MENTTETPNANDLPAGIWVASDLADHRLLWGDRTQVIGDSIPADDLAGLVAEAIDTFGPIEFDPAAEGW